MNNDPLQQPIDPIECPFCQSKYAPRLYGWHEQAEDGHYQHRYAVRCLNCGARGPHKEIGPHAIEAWNRRLSPRPAAQEVPVEGMPEYFKLPAAEMVELRNAAIKYFYGRVCRQAEKNMELTNTVSGAHWNAMRQVLRQMGIEDAPGASGGSHE